MLYRLAQAYVRRVQTRVGLAILGYSVLRGHLVVALVSECQLSGKPDRKLLSSVSVVLHFVLAEQQLEDCTDLNSRLSNFVRREKLLACQFVLVLC